MAAITRIDVQVITADVNGAGTDGNIYIGVCGREFRLDSSADDFERNSDRVYTFGNGTNVNNAVYNDPRVPQLDTTDLSRFPVYLRFEPTSASDNWCLDGVNVTVNPGSSQVRYTAYSMIGGDAGANLWMGQYYGKHCFLKRLEV